MTLCRSNLARSCGLLGWLLLTVPMGLAGCAALAPAAPPAPAVKLPAEPPPPEVYVTPRSAAAAPSSGAVPSGAVDAEAPRLIRGTDRVIGVTPTPPAVQGAPIELRFEDSPVREVVHVLLGELLKADYVLYPPLEGRVTIATARAIAPDQALFLLEAALQANGLSMARDTRGVFHVGKAEALRAIVPAVRQAGRDPLPAGQGAIIVPLRYIGAAEMANILRPLAPADAIVRVDTVRNLLVLSGTRAQAEGWMSLVSTFDIDLLSGMSVGVFPLKYVTVREVEAALQMMGGGAGAGAAAATGTPRPQPGTAAARAAATAPSGLPDASLLAGAVRVLPIERLNSIVVVTPRAAYLDEARRWIERLDQPSNSASEPRLHVYPVRNGSARHLGEVLNGIFGGGTASSGGGTASGVAPGLSTNTGRTTGGAATGTSSGGTGLGGAPLRGTGQSVVAGQGVLSSQLANDVRVVADERNNAVLVYGSASQFERIEAALRRLDLPPTQVLIEASIVEVTLTDDMEYGLQWQFSDSSGAGTGIGSFRNSNTGLPPNVGGGIGGALNGFSYVLRRASGRVPLVLNALAQKNLVRVISTPSLMVLDNHTAQISVGNQQPIRTAETVNTDGDLRTSSIQYKDTGVSLAVTPSVGAGDMVTMDILQAITDVGAVDGATGQRTFLQRQIGSKVAVRSGETLVLGGLIRDNNTDGSAGVPLLHEIPVVGALFGTKTKGGNRTELLVLITPRVARSDDDTRDISRELRERMSSLDGLVPGVPARRGEALPQPLPEGISPSGPSEVPSEAGSVSR